jgi:tetratricopeptide (TPR) repeat protein
MQLHARALRIPEYHRVTPVATPSMKRTQRNLFIIMAAMVAFYSIVSRLPGMAALAVLGAALIVIAVLAILAREYFASKRLMRRRQWQAAIEKLKKLEQKLLKASWQRASSLLYLNVYTFDGVALVRNQVAQCFMNLDDFDQAVRWLRSALLRDPHFAIPYVNLALIAAQRKDETNARREMSRAIQLGFNPATASRLLRRALEEQR